MFLITALVVVSLFILSISIPFLSFTLPVYKIKKMSKLGIKERLLVNLLAGLILLFLDPLFLVVYIGFFIVVEMLYYYFRNFKPEVAIFDRIFITSLTVTLIMGLYSYFIKDDLTNSLETLKVFYSTNLNFTTDEVNMIIDFLKSNYLFLLFVYSAISTYFTYYILEGKNYKNWGISYKWTILYIVGFIVNKFIKIDNYYDKNLLSISKLIYIIFGIRVCYTILSQKINFKVINKVLAVAVAASFPTAVFIVGALKSFNVKVRITKK
ncbi:MAG: hypothetical protein RR191_00285 [Cetobacterium sp.]|uniref:hypothetical protein n=1 Tax=unclassified Cetobacterium TaxID=2630983 RepID=UPI00163B8F42|nr:hypothetical protein [Cetobacterium sp. 2A]MBC2856636.1 hypothetical protein [Cetobacterium sp. 2A]